MQKTISLLLLIFISLVSVAQTEKVVKSKIKSVTVYQESAEITRQAQIHLPKGKTTLIFNGLSSKLDSKSVQAKGNNELMIVSISQNIDYLNKIKVSSKIEQLENKKLLLKDSISLISSWIKVYKQEKDMILSNKNIGGNDGVNINELKSAASFFRSRLMEIESKTIELARRKLSLQTKFIEIAKQLLELNSKSNMPTGVVKVVVSAKSERTYLFDLKYIVSDAGWEPNYDIRISDVNQPLNLFYKAKVFQNTDEDWVNVKLILSTGNPNISNKKPELSTYYLTFDNYYKHKNNYVNNNRLPVKGTVYGTVTEAETGYPVPGVTVKVKGTTIGTVTDIDGKYKINVPPGNHILVFNFIGLQAHEQYVKSGEVNVVLESSSVELDEVVLTAKASRRKKLFRRESSNKTEHIPLAIEKRQTSTEFEIEIPYSIPSDNQSYDVTMVEYQVPADYYYSSVPKLSEDAYLTAKIPDWTKYEMINGKANLFFQGIYQGETYLDLKSFEDTLTVSVGRDKDIVISRTVQKDFSKKSVIGSYKKDLKAWEITIKNNKNYSVDLLLEDQFPISQVSDIKVEQIEASGANINKDDGKLTWKLKLKAKEKKVLIVKYEVKYPKNRNLIID